MRKWECKDPQYKLIVLGTRYAVQSPVYLFNHYQLLRKLGTVLHQWYSIIGVPLIGPPLVCEVEVRLPWMGILLPFTDVSSLLPSYFLFLSFSPVRSALRVLLHCLTKEKLLDFTLRELPFHSVFRVLLGIDLGIPSPGSSFGETNS